jgi:hypothetical protein
MLRMLNTTQRTIIEQHVHAATIIQLAMGAFHYCYITIVGLTFTC